METWNSGADLVALRRSGASEWNDAERTLITNTRRELQSLRDNRGVVLSRNDFLAAVFEPSGTVIPTSVFATMREKTGFTAANETLFSEWVVGRFPQDAPEGYQKMAHEAHELIILLVDDLTAGYEPDKKSKPAKIKLHDVLAKHYGTLDPRTRDAVLALAYYNEHQAPAHMFNRRINSQQLNILFTATRIVARDLLGPAKMPHIVGLGYNQVWASNAVFNAYKTVHTAKQETVSRLRQTLSRFQPGTSVPFGEWVTTDRVPAEHYRQLIEHQSLGHARQESHTLLWGGHMPSSLHDIACKDTREQIRQFLGTNEDERAIRASYLLCQLQSASFVADVPIDNRAVWFEGLGLGGASETRTSLSTTTTAWEHQADPMGHYEGIVRKQRLAAYLISLSTEDKRKMFVPQGGQPASSPYDRPYLAASDKFRMPSFDIGSLRKEWGSDSPRMISHALMNVHDCLVGYLCATGPTIKQAATKIASDAFNREHAISTLHTMPMVDMCRAFPSVVAVTDVLKAYAYRMLWHETVGKCHYDDVPRDLLKAIELRAVRFVRPAFIAAGASDAPHNSAEVAKVVERLESAYAAESGEIPESSVRRIIEHPSGQIHGGIWLEGEQPESMTTDEYYAHTEGARKWIRDKLTVHSAQIHDAVASVLTKSPELLERRAVLASERIEEAYHAVRLFRPTGATADVYSRVLAREGAEAYFSSEIPFLIPKKAVAKANALGAKLAKEKSPASALVTMATHNRDELADDAARRHIQNLFVGDDTVVLSDEDIKKLPESRQAREIALRVRHGLLASATAGLYDVRAWTEGPDKSGIPQRVAKKLTSHLDWAKLKPDDRLMLMEQARQKCARWIGAAKQHHIACTLAAKRTWDNWSLVESTLAGLAKQYQHMVVPAEIKDMVMRVRVAEALGSWALFSSLPPVVCDRIQCYINQSGGYRSTPGATGRDSNHILPCDDMGLVHAVPIVLIARFKHNRRWFDTGSVMEVAEVCSRWIAQINRGQPFKRLGSAQHSRLVERVQSHLDGRHNGKATWPTPKDDRFEPIRKQFLEYTSDEYATPAMDWARLAGVTLLPDTTTPHELARHAFVSTRGDDDDKRRHAAAYMLKFWKSCDSSDMADVYDKAIKELVTQTDD